MRQGFLDGLIAGRYRGRAIAFLAAGFVLLVTTVVLPATGPFQFPDYGVNVGSTGGGTVERIEELERQPGSRGDVVTERITVSLDAAPEDEPVVIERRYVAGATITIEVAAGDRVLVTRTETAEGPAYYIADRRRTGALWILGGAFVLLVLAVGRWHGLGSLIGLGASFLVIVRFVIPGILAGLDPVAVAVAGALTIVATTLLLAHGPNARTALAIAATALALGATSVLSVVVVRMLALGGLADEDPLQLFALTGGAIDARGLLLAGFILGALGVLDDVTTTQVGTVAELRSANAALGPRELYRRAMNVGRDHVAATVNTLMLAYAGAALPLLLVLATQGEPGSVLIHRELFATELARTLAGSLGIVSAVPIATVLAALAFGRGRSGGGSGNDRSEGGATL